MKSYQTIVNEATQEIEANDPFEAGVLRLGRTLDEVESAVAVVVDDDYPAILIRFYISMTDGMVELVEVMTDDPNPGIPEWNVVTKKKLDKQFTPDC